MLPFTTSNTMEMIGHAKVDGVWLRQDHFLRLAHLAGQKLQKELACRITLIVDSKMLQSKLIEIWEIIPVLVRKWKIIDCNKKCKEVQIQIDNLV